MRQVELVVWQKLLVECLEKRSLRLFEVVDAPQSLVLRPFRLEARRIEPKMPPAETEVRKFFFVLPRFESEGWQNEDDLRHDEEDLPHFQGDVPHNELEMPHFVLDESR
jgi:hypothetical protein